MLIVAGTTLKQLEPRVWDPASRYYLPNLRAIMVSFAEFGIAKTLREKAVSEGLHIALGASNSVKVYLDNGAFSNIRSGKTPNSRAYKKFVEKTNPDWYPVPADYIPLPDMTTTEQYACYRKTMGYNINYSYDGYVSVVHAGPKLKDYLEAIAANDKLSQKQQLALGGLVPQLLQTKGTGPKTQVVDSIITARQQFDGEIHVFGIGGTATLHIAATLGMDSVDSSGWRNRAARGIIQLPGRGDRLITQLGTWRGRALDKKEEDMLAACECPGCKEAGVKGLEASGAIGFYRRATHNLYVLLNELNEIESHLANDTYRTWYPDHVFNSVFLKLIDYALSEKDKLNQVKKS